uniref:Cytosolic fatty-acid binding proteins domain-containing protein n=1 Tax=Plectus sambesii TaxID=2011161 RepID=A0A914VA80_9BILA
MLVTKLWLLVSCFAMSWAFEEFDALIKQDQKRQELRKNKVDPKLYDKMKNMHQHWYIGAVRGLLGAVGKELYQNLPSNFRQELAECLNAIKDEEDVAAGAKCVSRAFDLEESAKETVYTESGSFGILKQENKESTNGNSQEDLIQNSVHSSEEITKAFVQSNDNEAVQEENSSWLGMVVQNSSIDNKKRSMNRKVILPSKQKVSRIHRLNELAQLAYNRRRSPSKTAERMSASRANSRVAAKRRAEKEALRRHRRSPHRLAGASDDEQDTSVLKLNGMPNLFEHGVPATESPVLTMSRILTQIITKKSADQLDGNTWRKTNERLDHLKKQLSSVQNAQNADQTFVQRRLFDIVTDSGQGGVKSSVQAMKNAVLGEGKDDAAKLGGVPFLTDAFKLIKMLSENNVTQSVKLFSPRIAPIMKDQRKGSENLFSPSLLSLYRDDSPNNIASLPEILGHVGLSKEEQDKMMEMVMEMSGSMGIVNKILDNVDNPKNLLGLGQDILDATERIGDAWTGFQSSLSKEQHHEINHKGYSFMDKQQLETFYGKDGPFKSANAADMQEVDLSKATPEERKQALRATIKQIADELPPPSTNSSSPIRAKRALNNYFAGPFPSPRIILTPFAFAPTIDVPSIMGATILSPSVFSPFINNLQVLTPAILSPGIGNPYIISPYLLTPLILSPTVFIPYILSPFVFGPFILSPLVMAPFVLSPYVLSPNVLNPYALSPLVLSPNVLSPDVLSPTVLGGSVLSPTVLSPAVATEYFLDPLVLRGRLTKNTMASQLLFVAAMAVLATFALAAPGDNRTISNSITEPDAGLNSNQPTPKIHPLSQQYLGQWQLVSSENFDKYMEVIGVNPLARTFGNAAKPLLDIKFEDGRFKVMTEIHGFRTVTYDFVLNKEFDEVTPDGRIMKSIFRLRRDGKLIQFQKKISSHDKDSKFIRSVEGDKLIVICEAEGGVTAKRVYQKVPATPATTTPAPFTFPVITAGTLPPLPTGLPIFSLAPVPTGIPVAADGQVQPAAPGVAPFSTS